MDINRDPLPPDTLPAVKISGPAEADRLRDELRIKNQIPTWDTVTRFVDSLVRHFETESDTPYAVNFDTFDSSWTQAAWSKLYRIDRQACDWAKQTVLLTFTGSYYFDQNGDTPIPPITYFDRLQESAAARQQALHRALSDTSEWQSIRAVGVANRKHSAYPAVFLGLYLSSCVDSAVLKPVVDAHIQNCLIAERDAHQLHKTVTATPNPSHKSKLIHGLGKRVPGLRSNEGITAEPWSRRATAAVLYAGGWRCLRFGEST